MPDRTAAWGYMFPWRRRKCVDFRRQDLDGIWGMSVNSTTRRLPPIVTPLWFVISTRPGCLFVDDATIAQPVDRPPGVLVRRHPALPTRETHHSKDPLVMRCSASQVMGQQSRHRPTRRNDRFMKVLERRARSSSASADGTSRGACREHSDGKRRSAWRSTWPRTWPTPWASSSSWPAGAIIQPHAVPSAGQDRSDDRHHVGQASNRRKVVGIPNLTDYTSGTNPCCARSAS